MVGATITGEVSIFERRESEVRSYCRSFPTVFVRAAKHEVFDAAGRRYIDFFAGAGTLNLGHNHPVLQRALVDYIERDGITHALDMSTEAKARFLDAFERLVLLPRDLPYKVQFPGPTGTNAVEAALKLARKVTKRPDVAGFTHGYHGMTLGALSITANLRRRAGAGVPLTHASTLPYENYHGEGVDSLALIERTFAERGSGVSLPAAVVVETIQAEGGVRVASAAWLRGVAELCRRHGVLFIVDDIQVGCWRTGRFFSFEEAGVVPDIVCLSKSISGLGLPLALVLIRPELDIWEPGEHNGTFRGNNHAFVTATAALEVWDDPDLLADVQRRAQLMAERTATLAGIHAGAARSRGRGLITGVAYDDPGLAGKIARQAFTRGVIVETAGPDGEVLKLLPPLVTPDDALHEGFDVIESCAREFA